MKERIIGENVFVAGMIEKNTNYYILREKEEQYYGGNDGNIEYNIMEANWYLSYKDAKMELDTYDNPNDWDIIRISCLVRLEEVM